VSGFLKSQSISSAALFLEWLVVSFTETSRHTAVKVSEERGEAGRHIHAGSDPPSCTMKR